MKHIKPGRGPSAMGAAGSLIAAVFGVFAVFYKYKDARVPA